MRKQTTLDLGPPSLTFEQTSDILDSLVYVAALVRVHDCILNGPVGIKVAKHPIHGDFSITTHGVIRVYLPGNFDNFINDLFAILKDSRLSISHPRSVYEKIRKDNAYA
jgi:hypothetical protein